MYFLSAAVKFFLEIPVDCVYTPVKGLKGFECLVLADVCAGVSPGSFDGRTSKSLRLPRSALLTGFNDTCSYVVTRKTQDIEKGIFYDNDHHGDGETARP